MPVTVSPSLDDAQPSQTSLLGSLNLLPARLHALLGVSVCVDGVTDGVDGEKTIHFRIPISNQSTMLTCTVVRVTEQGLEAMITLTQLAQQEWLADALAQLTF